MKLETDGHVPAASLHMLRLNDSLKLLCRRLEQNFEQQSRLDRFVSLAQDSWELQTRQFHHQLQQMEATINTWLSSDDMTPRLAIVPSSNEGH